MQLVRRPFLHGRWKRRRAVSACSFPVSDKQCCISRAKLKAFCPFSHRFDCSRMAGWVAAQFATLILSLVASFPPTLSSSSLFQNPPHQPADGDPPAAVERNDRDGLHVRTSGAASLRIPYIYNLSRHSPPPAVLLLMVLMLLVGQQS